MGALLPWPPDQGLCPWTPLGAEPPDPHYRLALPRSPCPRLQTPVPDWDSKKVATLPRLSCKMVAFIEKINIPNIHFKAFVRELTDLVA